MLIAMGKDLGDTIQEMLNQAGRLRKYDLSSGLAADLMDIHNEVLYQKVIQLNKAYSKALKGTPEEVYLSSLVRHYSEQSAHATNLYKQINDLGLHPSTVKALEKADLQYLGELAMQSEEQLRGIRQIGPARYEEIRFALERAGLEPGVLTSFQPPKEQ
jgi:DNA-directed RNA polymerase alpha subunit